MSINFAGPYGKVLLVAVLPKFFTMSASSLGLEEFSGISQRVLEVCTEHRYIQGSRITIDCECECDIHAETRVVSI